jgi:opacity protein-like surface antigen
MKRIAIVALLLSAVAAVPAMAEGDPAAGKFGLGYFRSEAPVGVRYWFNEKAGLDFGLGFSSTDQSGETLNGFTFDVGVPFVVAKYEGANFFIRPGFAYQTEDQWGGTEIGKYKLNTWGITADLGVEYFFNDRFSLQAAHGIAYKSSKPDLTGAESTNSFVTEAFGISNIGFHFYFK